MQNDELFSYNTCSFLSTSPTKQSKRYSVTLEMMCTGEDVLKYMELVVTQI